MNLECEQALIDAIDNGDLEEEKDFYDLLGLAFEENKEDASGISDRFEV